MSESFILHYLEYILIGGERYGKEKSFGEISVIPKADALKYFSGTFSSVGGGTKYYLVAYRTESDGRRIEADGTLKNI